MRIKVLAFILCLIGCFVNADAQRRPLGKRSVQQTLKEQNTIISVGDEEEEKNRIDRSNTIVGAKFSESSVFTSDVDINIPQTVEIQENTFAVIIANENYTEVEKVPYALRDGELFNMYCTKALGIPKGNIHLVKDATLNNIRKQIRWLSDIMEVYSGNAKIIFYYSGHGIPDEKDKNAYLLPVDGSGLDYESGYALSELYESLGNMPAQSVVVFLDACFSGAKRDGGMFASTRGVAIKAKPSKPVGNMIVFSAAQSDETALPYEEQQHGMFTYFLLKKIQDEKGKIKMGELSDYVIEQVKRRSVVVNQKSQTPMINSSGSLSEKWEEYCL